VLQLAIGLGASTALLGQLLEGAGLEGGASLVHHRDASGRTALHMAAQSGAALAVDALLARAPTCTRRRRRGAPRCSSQRRSRTSSCG